MVVVAATAVWVVLVEEIPEHWWPQLCFILNAPERERAERFVFNQHCRQYQAAHALKRLMLSAAVSNAVAPERWEFESGPQGKPRIAHRLGPHFNISHCEGLVACAVSQRAELGIDVENLDRNVPLDTAASYFTIVEQAWLSSLPVAEQTTGFLKLWTLKEAYIKATGLGLTQSLSSFAFQFEPLRVMFDEASLGSPAVWCFDQHHIGKRHLLALARRSDAATGDPGVDVVRLETLLGAWSPRV